ncbi:hypothetical protein GUJ93_ZPchr0008g11475 [Zizania palustris]|uniref:t-SNARE coiled-coil homology domain-containing protein n=1 Tax=Zizania palustris TaxID=103762 RepID=A0A8J5RU00_ZIZPA|nr:hypothetical protein GUJ93_ZPchr0008g11475 [Zizania palustris]
MDALQEALPFRLGQKYASVPVAELKDHPDFYEDLLRENIHMTVRLVVSYNGLSIGTVRDAFEKSLCSQLQKMNHNTDYHCLNTFGSYFSEHIRIPAGTKIDFRQTSDNANAGVKCRCPEYVRSVTDNAKLDASIEKKMKSISDKQHLKEDVQTSTTLEAEEEDPETSVDLALANFHQEYELTGDIHKEVENHNRMLDRMGNDMNDSRGFLSGTVDKFKMVFETKSSRNMATMAASFIVVFFLIYSLHPKILDLLHF